MFFCYISNFYIFNFYIFNSKYMYLLGYELGSSSVKASLVNAETGECVASAFFPKKEMEIKSVKAGWAEQDTEVWWTNLKLATEAVLSEFGTDSGSIKGIGISYQMHVLVLVDEIQMALMEAESVPNSERTASVANFRFVHH